MNRGLVSMFAIATILFMTAPSFCDETVGAQQTATLDKQVPVRMNYLVYLPQEYDQQESWPLVLFLHGAGERGDNLDLVKRHGPPKLIEAGQHFPFLVVSPQCPKNRWWESYELVALLDEVVEKYNVDEDRVYLTGLSMGGFGSWSLAAYRPERFAAVAPICGGGEPFLTRFLRDLPVWVFHGAKDFVIPIDRSQEMVDALKKRKGNVKFTIYPDAGHDAWTETYDNPEFFEWMLEQKRGSNDKDATE